MEEDRKCILFFGTAIMLPVNTVGLFSVIY